MSRRTSAADRPPATRPTLAPSTPGLAPHAEDWPARGACRTADPDLFFHPYAEREPSRGARDAAAVAICVDCPVRRECRTHARATAEPYGVWGGETEDERDAWLRARAGRAEARPA